MDQIRRLISKHPLINPLVGQTNESETFEVNLGAEGEEIPFQVQLKETGFYVYVVLKEGIQWMFTDGKTNTQDYYLSADQENTRNYVPLLESVNVSFLTAYPMLGMHKMLVLYIPHNRISNMYFFNFNWCFNEEISGFRNYDHDLVEKVRFVNIWTRFGDDDNTHYIVDDVKFDWEKSIVELKMKIPEGFRNVTQFKVFCQVGTRMAHELITINVKDNALQQWAPQRDFKFVLHSMAEKIMVCQCSLTPQVKEYILQSFQYYVWEHETTIQSIETHPSIRKLHLVPLNFCTQVASTLNSICQIVYKDELDRIVFNPVDGFRLNNIPWRTGAVLRLPIISLQTQALAKLISRIRAIESQDPAERTLEQWQELARLSETLRMLKSTSITACVVCNSKAIFQAQTDYAPLCSIACAKKRY